MKKSLKIVLKKEYEFKNSLDIISKIQIIAEMGHLIEKVPQFRNNKNHWVVDIFVCMNYKILLKEK